MRSKVRSSTEIRTKHYNTRSNDDPDGFYHIWQRDILNKCYDDRRRVWSLTWIKVKLVQPSQVG